MKAKAKAKQAAPKVSREELLAGVLDQLRKEASKRAANAEGDEKGRWEWVVKVTDSALGGR